MSVPAQNTETAKKEPKVIVLSMKDGKTFRFDFSTNILTNVRDREHSIIPKSPPSSGSTSILPSPSSQAVKINQPQQNINVVSQAITSKCPVAIQKPGNILIRAQSPAIMKTPSTIHANIQMAPPNLIMKTQAPGNTVLINSSSIQKSASMANLQAVNTTKKIIVAPAQQAGQPSKLLHISQAPKVIPQQIMKISQVKPKDSPRPILPKPDPQSPQQKFVVQQHVILSAGPSVIVQQQNPIKPQNVINIPAISASSFGKFNAQKFASLNPPALTPIQPKLSATIVQQPTSQLNSENNKIILEVTEQADHNSSDSEVFDDDDEDDEIFNDDEEDENTDDDDNDKNISNEITQSEEKTPDNKLNCTLEEEEVQKQQQQQKQFLDVKRIIEGDDDDLKKFVEKSSSSSFSNNNKSDNDHVLKNADNNTTNNDDGEISDLKVIKNTTTTTTTSLTHNVNIQNSDSLLLCDEEIAEESPESLIDKAKEIITPIHMSESVIVKTKSVEDVKKNLKLDLIETHESKKIEMDDDEFSEGQSNHSSMIEQKQNTENDVIQATTTTTITNQQVDKDKKPKRSRKPKNPTIIPSLGLPYKPPQPSNRRKKVEKKIELELDFHDPLYKIIWDDGVGNLNNCNKLFGFNEFGLVEVLSKKDATAKLKLYEENPLPAEENASFKLRKIVDPKGQFVCEVCSKLGTVRDFFSPECCSESCFAITKRRPSESFNSSKDEIDSGVNSPTDAKMISFGGKMLTIQQVQQHLLEKQLPESKRTSVSKKIFPSLPEMSFSWDTYLTAKSVPAPAIFFKSSQILPKQSNHFKVGMKVEAIDPYNQHMFCVCTIEEKLGCRIKLHFDGYPSIYDFWTNVDSFYIFPTGFCQNTNRKLQVPPRWTNRKFDWSEYFDHTNSVGAQRFMFQRFSSQASNEKNPFAAGMKLEVKYENYWYAATIIDVLENRILIRFDGIYEKFGCAWFDIYSPYLNPCNGHKTLHDSSTFIPPNGSTYSFEWSEYLKKCDAAEAPGNILYFKKRQPYKFESGMKLEVVDPVCPQLIRPATIVCRNDYRIQVNFDGFDINYAFWLDDDSDDIYPINYCKETEHPIEHPAGLNKFGSNGLCIMAGCRGIGNGFYLDRYFHDNPKECPYNVDNWKVLLEKSENTRLEHKPNIKRGLTKLQETPPQENRSITNSRKRVKREKIEDEVNETASNSSPMTENFDETSNEIVVVKVPGKRGRKRKIQPPQQAADIVNSIKEEDITEEDKTKKIKIRVVKDFLEEYGPQINYAFNLWTNNSKVLNRATITDDDDDLTENPMKWSIDDVCTFIVKFCDEETTAKFYAQKIDGEALLSLCHRDLINLMNIKVGPAIKIYNRILHLRQEVMTKFAEF